MISGFQAGAGLVALLFAFIFYRLFFLGGKSAAAGYTPTPGSAAPKPAKKLNWSKAKSVAERKKLEEAMFAMIDKNRDGNLQIDELKSVMTTAADFLRLADANSDKGLSGEEFKAFLNKHVVNASNMPDTAVDKLNKLLSLANFGKKKATRASADSLFSSMDLNDDGVLSNSEIAEVLGADAQKFLRTLDTISADGQVDRAEFLKWASANGDTPEYKEMNSHLAYIYGEASKGLFDLIDMEVNTLVAKEKKAAEKQMPTATTPDGGSIL